MPWAEAYSAQYVEGSSDARTMLGERCVSAHLGWVGEKSTGFHHPWSGGTTRYTYEDNNPLTTITGPKGITFIRNFYGPSGRVLRQVQADGREHRSW